VNKALATLKSNGTLAKLTTQYLKDFTSVPTIQP
jgi:ABC-type amino acid transport substrate-binding protein